MMIRKIPTNFNDEGAYVHAFMQEVLSESDITGKKVLEVGPKHGLHTSLIDIHKPKSITLVELLSKKIMLDKWVDNIKSHVNVHYCDLLRFQTDEKFDLIIFSGILYHNTEQLRLLKKLRSLASPNAKLVCESATTRNPTFEAQNAIEVLYPAGYRNGPSIMFLPSKKALISLVSMACWDVDMTSDESSIPDVKHDQRLALVASASDRKHTSYDVTDIDHSYVDD
jgi:SAM-dependent methyltransferase